MDVAELLFLQLSSLSAELSALGHTCSGSGEGEFNHVHL